MLHVDCKVAIIGGGVLGMSIAYFLSAHAKSPESVALLEQENNIAQHSSSRNTGKVHAPFLYDPTKKKTFAKAAALGYEMWQKYSSHKRMPFRRDGVLEVALNDKGIDRLYKYMEWGMANGLTKNELQLLTKMKWQELSQTCGVPLQSIAPKMHRLTTVHLRLDF